MAQYRLSVYVAKRSDNRNAVAMAAYRAGEKLLDQKTGQTIDFTRKQGVIHAEIITPEHAPQWASDRAALWNRSEAAHRRGDAVIAREIQLSLPHELSDAQRRELTTGFARFLAEHYNVAVDTCLHAPNTQGDERNHHAHLLICTRPFDDSKAHGLGNNVRAFDAVSHQKAQTENHVETWRATWAQQMNDALERAEVRTEEGATVKVDHRSYERQGVDQEPTIKEGTATTALKRRGEDTERAAQNDDIRRRNQEHHQECAQLVAAINADAQALDVLVRRQAELMAAREAKAALTPGPDPTATLTPRAAQHLVAPEVQRELTAANDNTPGNDNANDNAPKGPRHHYKRMPDESDEEYGARVERAERRAEKLAREAPKLELKPKGPNFGY